MPDAPIGDRALTFEEVLEAELRSVHAARPRRDRAAGALPATRPGPPAAPGIGALDQAHAAGLVGLAFSGGGIRSATFNLGVLQSLAALKLLPWVDYLSTVSGGGYIGSWLAAWIRRDGFARVETGLASPAPGKDRRSEPSAIQFLREFSNYLTPKLGLFGADTWAAVAIYLTNLTLNLIILVLFLASLLLAPRVLVLASERLVKTPMSGAVPAFALLLFSVLAVGLNHRFIHERTVGEPEPGTDKARKTTRRFPPYTSQEWTQGLCVLPLILATWLAARTLWLYVDGGDTIASPGKLVTYSGAAYALAWIVARLIAPERTRGHSWFRTVLSAFLSGLAAGGMTLVVGHLFQSWKRSPDNLWHVAVCGTPLMIGVFTLAATFHLGLLGKRFGDARHEWWGRLGGWLLIYGIGWGALFAAAVYGPLLVLRAGTWTRTAVGSGWLLTSLYGILASKSAVSRGRTSKRWLEYATLVAPYLFVAGLLLILSLGVHFAVGRVPAFPWPGETDGCGPTNFLFPSCHWIALSGTLSRWLIVWSLGFFALAGLLSRTVDINEFSMHHFYRNRLIRCYLGASHRGRDQQPFTGFDPDDDLRLADLDRYEGPLPVLNTALNLVRGKRLAWQERKAASFTFTPLHSGSESPPGREQPDGSPPRAGYRPTPRYAYPDDGGISLGTVMAISGAAASPNMGYHSSPAVSFLLTLFNVRLGWWLGNPRDDKKWREAGPGIGLAYLLNELVGRTNENAQYVYLSDGGHFENLALYELVRRRCRFIIAGDAEADPAMTFSGLGNAIRKCRIDFGIEIDLDVHAIQPREESGCSRWHCAVGTIHYEKVDPGASPGTLVYIKSSVTGNEPEDLLNYRSTHSEFPHESTADQWFDESQFESYRKLGEHVARTVLGAVPADVRAQGKEAFFVTLRQIWTPPRRAVLEDSSEHHKVLDRILETLRTDPDLRFLDAQIYPEWERLAAYVPDAPPPRLWLPERYEELRSGFYACNAMIQLMETVYRDLDLEEEHEHPDNRSWMNLFRHWTWSGMFRVTWAICASLYDGRFQGFCRRNLGLEAGAIEVDEMPVATFAGATGRGGPPAELNFLEREILADLLGPRSPFLAAHRAPDRLFVMLMSVRDPTRRPDRSPEPDEKPVRLPFGFALARGEELAYLRVQDHVRNMGLAREALVRMVRDHRIRAIAPLREDDFPPALRDKPSKDDLARLKQLFDSVRFSLRPGE